MFAGGLIISCTLFGFAIWLQRTEQIGWPNDSFDQPSDQEYLRQRRKSRGRVNLLIFICGLLVLVATLAGQQRQFWWISGWLSAMATLGTVVLLAGLDALRTLRHYRDKLNRARRSD